jgi:hypothetical protein
MTSISDGSLARDRRRLAHGRMRELAARKISDPATDHRVAWEFAQTRIDFLCRGAPSSHRSKTAIGAFLSDVLYLAIGLGAFALLALYAIGCGRA